MSSHTTAVASLSLPGWSDIIDPLGHVAHRLPDIPHGVLNVLIANPVDEVPIPFIWVFWLPVFKHVAHTIGGVPVHINNVNLLSKFDADESPCHYADALANVGRMFFCPLPCRFRLVFDPLRDIPTRIHMIDRVILAIQIPVQGQWAIQVAQPLVRARPPAYCRLVVARPRATTPHRRRRGSPMPPQSDRGWHCCPTATPRCRRLRLSTCWLLPEGCLLQRIYDVARYLSDMFAPSHAINAERIAELAACVLSLTSAFSRASRIACLLSPLTISASV
jgi:hypothetical protein